MGKKLSTRHDYDAPVDQVWAMLTDEAYWRGKYEALGYKAIEVLECRADGDGWVIRTRRDVPANVPSFAKKFLPDTVTMTQTDRWGPLVEGAREGTFELEGQGTPVKGWGTMRLAEAGGGAAEDISGEVKASVPLVGGKLEGVVADQTLKALEQEHEFGRDWLRSH